MVNVKKKIEHLQHNIAKMTVFYVCCVLEFGHSTDTLYDIVLPGQVYVGGVIMIKT